MPRTTKTTRAPEAMRARATKPAPKPAPSRPRKTTRATGPQRRAETRAAATGPLGEPAPRRTQAERRAGTQAKILAAAVEALLERGYAGTSTPHIAARAGVSQGGIFRHWATREALMVSVAEHVSHELLLGYRRQLARERRRGEVPLVAALALLLRACRHPLNHAWYELLMAARTDLVLQAALAPMMTRYFDDIEALARQVVPSLATTVGPDFRVLLETLVCVFDGESLHGFVRPAPALEDARLALLPRLLAQLPRARARSA
jgi:AcrR family transcriptional regulator